MARMFLTVDVLTCQIRFGCGLVTHLDGEKAGNRHLVIAAGDNALIESDKSKHPL